MNKIIITKEKLCKKIGISNQRFSFHKEKPKVDCILILFILYQNILESKSYLNKVLIFYLLSFKIIFQALIMLFIVL